MAFEKKNGKLFLFGAFLVLVTHLIGLVFGIPEEQQFIHAALNIIAAFMILMGRAASRDSFASFIYGLGFVIVFITHVLMITVGTPQVNILNHNLINLFAYLLIITARNKMLTSNTKLV